MEKVRRNDPHGADEQQKAQVQWVSGVKRKRQRTMMQPRLAVIQEDRHGGQARAERNHDPAVRHAGESRPLYPDDDTVRYQRAGKNRYSGAAQVYRLKNNKNHKENPIDRNVSAVYGVLFSGLFTSQRRL